MVEVSPEEQYGNVIPEQAAVAWTIALNVSWAGLRRRLLRGLITMLGVVLAIAFLAYMLVTERITENLIAADVAELNVLLQKTGVDIYESAQTDEMTVLLIGLSLFTALVGILNSMIMAVAERVREIGTLKCLGARDSFIVKTYLIESSIQGILGSALGSVAGCLVALIIAVVNYRLYTFEFLPLAGFLSAMGISFAIGAIISVLASIAPAYMAARKQPVDALRVEE